MVKTDTHIYALEFKLDQPAETALQQIIDKEYLAPFRRDPRRKIAIGISFSSKDKKSQNTTYRKS